MAFLPLMPTGQDQVQTPMSTTGAPPMPPPGGMGGGGPMAGQMTGSAGGGGDLASLLGMGGAPQGMGMDPLQMGLSQFDQLSQMIDDMTRMFPGSEQMASQMMDVLDQWRQQVLIMNTPQPSSMPGADTMM